MHEANERQARPGSLCPDLLDPPEVAGTVDGVAALPALIAAVCFALAVTLWQTAAGIVGFPFQQLSLSTGRLVPYVAAVSGANPIVSVMLGALVLQERLDKNPPWHAVVAVGSLCLALLGGVVVSSARETEREVERSAPEPLTAPAQLSGGVVGT